MIAGIDRTWLMDQIPQLQDVSLNGLQDPPPSEDYLVLVEAQQFKPSSTSVVKAIDPRIQEQLDWFNFSPDKTWLFGRDSDLPQHDMFTCRSEPGSSALVGFTSI